MASAQGLTQRKRNAFAEADSESGFGSPDTAAASSSDSGVTTRREKNVAMDPSERFDEDDDKAKDGEKSKLTLLEEVLLLGIKDVQVRTSLGPCGDASRQIVASSRANFIRWSVAGISFILERQHILRFAWLYPDGALDPEPGCDFQGFATAASV